MTRRSITILSKLDVATRTATASDDQMAAPAESRLVDYSDDNNEGP